MSVFKPRVNTTDADVGFSTLVFTVSSTSDVAVLYVAVKCSDKSETNVIYV